MVVGFLPAIGSSLWSFDATGQAERLYAHARWYQRAGHQVDWFTYHPRDMAWPFGARVPAPTGIARAMLAPLHGRAWRRPRVFRALNLLGALPAVTAHFAYGTPFVVSHGADYEALAQIHGRAAWKWRWLQRLVLPRAAAVLVSNPDLAARLRGRFPTARVVDFPNWIDPNLFHPMETGERWKRPVARVYFVGRLVREKNLTRAVRAIRSIGARVVCVGGGPYADAVRAAGAETVGVQPWPSLPGWLADAEAFIMPSLSEGQPKALLEAMACGVPCLIADQITGLAGYPGRRVDATNAEDIAAQTGKLLAHEDEAMALGEQSRALVIERNAVEHVMPREIELVRAAR